MGTVKFVYLDQEIEFDADRENIMVNATEMAKVFDKKVEAFMRNESTVSFISECLKSENSSFLGIENQDGLFISKQKSGTWMHRILALKFAAWLNPAFEFWIFSTIDKLINAEFREQRDALIEKMTAKQKRELTRESIIKKYADLPEIAEYFQLEDAEKSANIKRIKAFRAQMQQLKFNFNDEKK